MKRWNKLLIVFTIAALFIALFSFSALAEELIEEPKDELSLEDLEFTFTYTSDSVVKEGFTTQLYTDPISKQYGVELVPNFGIGYAIYDNPDTEIIDGIRINDAEVTSLRIPISEENPTLTYTVAVRTVYVESAAGSLAQILDGTFDYTKLLTNPVIVLQIVYWSFMAVTGIAGFLILIFGKGKKVKTSNEIAGKVTEKMSEFKAEIVNTVTKVVSEEVLPLARASVKSSKEAVKAIVLSKSNSKEAPLALLDVFKDSEDVDVEDIVENVRESVLKALAEHEENRAKVAETVQNITGYTCQEGVNDETKTTETVVKTAKSVF